MLLFLILAVCIKDIRTRMCSYIVCGMQQCKLFHVHLKFKMFSEDNDTFSKDFYLKVYVCVYMCVCVFVHASLSPLPPSSLQLWCGLLLWHKQHKLFLIAGYVFQNFIFFFSFSSSLSCLKRKIKDLIKRGVKNKKKKKKMND